jgi:uncharacterized damage-inducible protein DinB
MLLYMMIDLLHNLYDYSAWANDRILGTAAQVTLDQLQAKAAERASFGSVHGTLVHIMSAQWIWLLRWQGTSPSVDLAAETFPTLETIRMRWDQIERETQEFLAACTEADLACTIEYQNFQGERWAYPLWQQMVHQVNHATQHRSEVAMILTQWGHSPGWLDLLYYVDLKGQGLSASTPLNE